MPKHRFGTSGVRGIYGEELSVDDAFKLASAAVGVLGSGSYGVAYDSRKGSRILSEAVVGCLSWLGCEVFDFGLLPTPVFSFNVRRLGLKAGFMLTASHNPPEYVGLKLLDQRGIGFPVEVEGQVESKLDSLIPSISEGGSVYRVEDAIPEYCDQLLERMAKTENRLRVVVDCGCGVGSLVTPLVLSELGHDVMSLNCHPSWKFEARPSEPTVDNLSRTALLTKLLGVDLGIAQDGDADRIVVMDGDGEVLEDYVVSSIVLLNVLERGRGDVVLSVNTSNVVEELALDGGCSVVRHRLGKTPEELYRRRGVFSAEPSKIVDASWGFWEDAVLAAAVVVQEASRAEDGLRSLINKIPKTHVFQRNLKTQFRDYGVLKKKALEHFRDYGEISETDGVKLIFKDKAWLLFRFSGTEPKARVYCEASDAKRARRLLDSGVELIQRFA